jgi:hypothetical protein
MLPGLPGALISAEWCMAMKSGNIECRSELCEQPANFRYVRRAAFVAAHLVKSYLHYPAVLYSILDIRTVSPALLRKYG